jgi:hypothetical protein
MRRRTCPPGAARGITLTVASAAVLALAACSPALDWRTLNIPGGDFSVLMPGRTEPETRSVELDGHTLTLHLHSVHIEGSAWGVAWAELPEGLSAPARTRVREAALAGWGRIAGQAIEPTPVAPSQADAASGLACQAIEARGMSGSREVTIAARACTTGRRYYQLIAIGPADALDAGSRAGDNTAFLASLQLH